MTDDAKAEFVRRLADMDRNKLVELAQTVKANIDLSNNERDRIEQRAHLECVAAVARLRFPRSAPPPSYVRCAEQIRKRVKMEQ